MALFDNKEKRNGAIGVVVTHLILLLLFLLPVLPFPVPPLEAESMAIDLRLGADDFGQGETNEQPVSQPVTEPETQPVEEPQEVEAAPDQLVTDPNADSPVEVPEPEEKPEEPEPEPKPQMDAALQSALNAVKDPNEETGEGGGQTNQPGALGRPNGSPTGISNRGVPGGKGYALDGFGDRGVKKDPVIVDDSQETGKVRVRIIVDKNGKVVSANAGAQGSTTTSAILLAAAQKAAYSMEFEPHPQGLPEQRGYVTIEFKLR